MTYELQTFMNGGQNNSSLLFSCADGTKANVQLQQDSSTLWKPFKGLVTVLCPAKQLCA